MLRIFKFKKLDTHPERSGVLGDQSPLFNSYLRSRLIEKIIYMRESNPDLDKNDTYNLCIRILENTQKSLIELLIELFSEKTKIEDEMKKLIDENEYEQVIGLKKKLVAMKNVIEFINEYKFNEGKI